MQEPVISYLGFDSTTEQAKFVVTLGGERFDYSSGIGNVPAKRQPEIDAEVRKIDNTGRALAILKRIRAYQVHSKDNLKEPTVQAVFRAIASRVEVKADDFFYSILSDTRAGDETFVDFCGNFGYDSDSIKAQDIWHACRANGRKLRTVLTPKEIETLEKKLENY